MPRDVVEIELARWLDDDVARLPHKEVFAIIPLETLHSELKLVSTVATSLYRRFLIGNASTSSDDLRGLPFSIVFDIPITNWN